MFGYITVNREELKVKDFECYSSFYCGVCQDLKIRNGQLSRLTLTYDCTFLAVLLTALYEKKPSKEKRACIVHPGPKRLCMRNEFTAYAADMNLILAYHNLMDDWIDEKKKRSALLAGTIKNAYKKASERYPRQDKATNDYVRALHVCEKENSSDLDRASGLTGDLFREIFTVYDNDIWNKDLGDVGFYLGKFIYLMDAWEDLEKDLKTGNYNPFSHYKDKENYDEFAGEILTSMASNAAAAFERLPVVEYVDILRNVLYAGLWQKYQQIKQKDKENKK